mmetsp:Transcript_24652/g.38329  ORF Transcript_24652/g.38329 Transcript_24652/m.38329 type:complete len:94 (-) Transcript_24652:805-1086(-)
MLIADKHPENPQDPFKQTYIPRIKNKEVSEKAFTKNFIKKQAGPPNRKAKAANQRWTEVELRYNKNKNRLFDVIPPAIELPSDYKPLFSSFNP